VQRTSLSSHRSRLHTKHRKGWGGCGHVFRGSLGKGVVVLVLMEDPTLLAREGHKGSLWRAWWSSRGT
jgi:hypothetical protein